MREPHRDEKHDHRDGDAPIRRSPQTDSAEDVEAERDDETDGDRRAAVLGRMQRSGVREVVSNSRPNDGTKCRKPRIRPAP